MTIWFTADHHFGHRNIIRFCGRPFQDVDEMDEVLIEEWNATVGSQDEVWHLGDFACRCGPNRAANIFGRLSGRSIHLVRGNHDRKAILDLPWASVQHYAELSVGGRLFILFHYGMRVWNRSTRNSIALYAHSHGELPPIRNSLDVGVDVWNFKPVGVEQILSTVESFPLDGLRIM